MEWEAILSDKSFQAQPPAVKARVAANYFRENIASDPSFAEQPEDIKSRVRGNFFSTIMEKPSFEARYPTLSAIEKTFRGVPRVIASGATLGLSERARESAQMLTGTKEDEPYSEIPSLSRGVGEFTGAAIPIGAVGTAIHKVTEIPKVATALSKNKWFEPLARMTGWGVAGGAYDTAESMIKRGEAPSLKDIAKSGAIWGGTEAALSSLGWTGRLASAVNTLAKSAGVSRVQMLNAIIKEAAERGLPVGMTAKKVVGEKAVQDAWDAFLKEKEAQAQDYLERLDLLSQGETVKPDANTSAMQKMLGITEEGMPTGAAEVVHGKSAPEFTHGTAAATRLPKSMEVASGSKSRLTKAEPGGARPVSELELEQVGRTESPAYEATEQGVIRSAPTEGDRMAALEGQRTADIAESIGAGGQVNTAVDDILSRTPFARSLADQLNRLKTLALPPGLSVEQHFVALSEQVGRLAFLSESDKRRLLRAVENDKAIALERERQAQMDEAVTTTAEVPQGPAIAPPAQEIRPVEATIPKETVDVSRGASEAKGGDKFNDFVDRAGRRIVAEQQGKASLEDIIDEGISPNDIATKFWDDTYFNLPPEQQRIFKRQYKAHSGGFDLNEIPEKEIVVQLDFPELAEHLQDTERGFVVLMHEANRRFGTRKAGASGTKDVSRPGEIVEPGATSGVKEPWQMTREEFEVNPPQGFQVKKLDKEDIARAETDGTISVDPDNFFGHAEAERKSIINHERAHFVEEKISPEYKATLFDNPAVMNYRGRNINEKLANMIQDGTVPPEVLKDYPHLSDKVIPKGSDTEEIFTRGSAGAIAGVGTDEEGNLTYDPVKGAAGMAGGIGLAGIIFRSKGAVKTLGRAPVTDAERVKAMYDETAAEIAKREAFSIQNVKDALKRNILDVSSKAKDMLANLNHPLSKEAVMRRDLIAGANSAAVQQFSQYEKNIYGGLQQGEEAILDRIINSRRTVQIGEYKDISHSRGLKPEQHKKYLDDIAGAEGIAKERADDLKARSDAYFAAMDDQLRQRLGAGLISQKQYDELSKYVYSPRRFFEHLDDIDRKISGRSITVGSSGIKGLQEGSEGLMETRTRGLLADHVSRTQDLIFRNKANQSLVQLANDLPENGVIRLAKRIGTRGTTGEPIYAEAPNGYEKLSAMVDGQQVPFIVPKEFADSWVKSDPMIQGALAQTLSWLSGSKILKAGATGYNPFFVLTNMPRDMALIWSGEQYSKHLPVAMGQMAKDLWTVAPDVFKRKGRVADYINEGGGMELLTHYGRFKGASEVGQKLNMASKVLGWVGETSELWTRIAHRERALQNGLSPVEATYAARTGSIDFSQGGSMVKAVDTVVPYLNAAIQGTRTLGRNAAKNPGTFTYKMAQLGAASAMLYAWNMQNPEAWSQISDRDKEANFIFIIPDVMPGATSYIDDKGAKRYRYIKIAKDQAQRVFTTAVESILQYAYEGKTPTKQVFAALSDLGVPWRVPAISALIAMGGYDDYTFGQIWRGPQGIAPQEEYTQDTPGVYVAAGKATGLSPERMRAATNKILPQNNPFISAFGTGVKTATGETAEELARKGWNQFVSESPSIRRVFAITSPSVGYQEQLEEEREASRTENFKQNRELDNLTQKFFKSGKQEDGQKILAYVQSQPESVQDRLVKRYEAAYEIKDLPDKGFWKQLRSMAPEARAKVLYKRIMEAKGPEQARILETANNLSGIVSDRMVEEWNRLTAGK